MPVATARARRLDLSMAALASTAALASVPTDRIHESAYTQPGAHGQQPDSTHVTRMGMAPSQRRGRSMAQVMLATMTPWDPSLTALSHWQLQGECAAAQQVTT